MGSPWLCNRQATGTLWQFTALPTQASDEPSSLLRRAMARDTSVNTLSLRFEPSGRSGNEPPRNGAITPADRGSCCAVRGLPSPGCPGRNGRCGNRCRRRHRLYPGLLNLGCAVRRTCRRSPNRSAQRLASGSLYGCAGVSVQSDSAMAAAIDRSERASRSTRLAFATFLGDLEM